MTRTNKKTNLPIHPSNQLWDVVVIGGGPAGMMAAGRAAELGARVLLIEKNETLGKKLLITGGGRCNVTNAEFDNRTLLARFKDDGKFLFSAFAKWSVKETLDFFHNRNMPTKVEREQRVFPVSDSAQSVWDVMVSYMTEHGVTVLSNAPVTALSLQKDAALHEAEASLMCITLKDTTRIKARSVIIATGGTSHPETGSTGDAYAWLAGLGHTIIHPTPSLVPLSIKDPWIHRLAGTSLTGIKLHLYQDGIKQNIKTTARSVSEKILFTHVGVSGPTILNMSKDVSELLKYGEVTITIDMVPKHDHGTLNAALQELFRIHDKKKIKNCLDLGEAQGLHIPAAMVPIILELAHIDPDTECNSITREERLGLITLLKGIPLQVKGLLGLNKAIISSGGIPLDEVDFKTMRSRLVPQLYFVGDILNIDRPSGGYSLQLCWTTGFVAGTDAGSLPHTRKTTA